MFRRGYYRLIGYFALVGGLLVLAMSMLTSIDILGRELLKSGITGCYELVQYLMVFVVFLPLAFLESKKGNVRVELIFSLLPPRLQSFIKLASAIFALMAFGLILYTSSVYAWESWVARETMYGIKGGPLYVWKFGVPIGCFFMCIEVIIDLKNAIMQLMERS